MSGLRQYQVKWIGDEEAVALLAKHVPAQFGSLGEARRKTRAARELFGVRAEIVTVRRAAAHAVVLEG